jgi:hypothetical protein
MADTSSKDTSAAYHEVGHAVGAFLLGLPFGDVVLAAPGSGEGSVHSPLTIGKIRQSNLRWEYAVVLMLGREAERLVFGRADSRYLREDAECIARLYLTFFASEMTCQQFREELRNRTKELVSCPGFHEAIEALACVLKTERVIPRLRAAELIRTVTSVHSSP